MSRTLQNPLPWALLHDIGVGLAMAAKYLIPRRYFHKGMCRKLYNVHVVKLKKKKRNVRLSRCWIHVTFPSGIGYMHQREMDATKNNNVDKLHAMQAHLPRYLWSYTKTTTKLHAGYARAASRRAVPPRPFPPWPKPSPPPTAAPQAAD